MKSPKTRFSPRVETLERLALLAVVAPAPSTGLGSVGLVGTTDAQALQQDASGGFLEQYISEIESLDGRRANVRQYAVTVVVNHQVTSFDLQSAASTLGVTLPTGIALPTDVADAQQVLASVRSGKVDQTYLKVMAQINAQDIADDQQLLNAASTAPGAGLVKAYAGETLGFDLNHLQGAKQLTQSPKSTYNPTVPTFSISPTPLITAPASANDTQALQQDGSGGALEQFISQIEVQRGTRGDAQQYAQSVVGDHQVTNYDLMTTAGATGVSIPSGINQASDINDALEVLGAVRRGNVDQTYLQVMAQINAQDVSSGQQLIATTTNTDVKTYAQETLSFDMTHLKGAQTLLAGRSDTYTPGG